MGGFFSRPSPPPPPAPRVQKEAVQSAPAGPTRAEMDVDARRRTARRGRRATILTSSKGVDQDVTLGQKTLLG